MKKLLMLAALAGMGFTTIGCGQPAAPTPTPPSTKAAPADETSGAKKEGGETPAPAPEGAKADEK